MPSQLCQCTDRDPACPSQSLTNELTTLDLIRMDSTAARRLARQCAKEEGLSPARTRTMLKLFTACLARRKLFPRVVGRRQPSPGKAYVAAWVSSYAAGVGNTGAAREIRPMGTTPDPIITMMIGAYEGVSKKESERRIEHHRMAMRHENLVGPLLEEYLAVRLGKLGWLCAWGSTIQHVDFMGPRGRLLQVKNRSNSENSASSSVRKKRPDIEKWHRLDASTGADQWHELRRLLRHRGRTQLGELDFQNFVRRALIDLRRAY